MGQRFTAVYMGGSFPFNKIVSRDLVVRGGKVCGFPEESEAFLLVSVLENVCIVHTL